VRKVPPSTRTREQIEALLRGDGVAEGEPVSLLVRLAVRRIVEEALEGAVCGLLGRDCLKRRDGQAGYRNGCREGRLVTGEGEVTYAVLQVREVDDAQPDLGLGPAWAAASNTATFGEPLSRGVPATLPHPPVA
jgi:hypothetical protein